MPLGRPCEHELKCMLLIRRIPQRQEVIVSLKLRAIYISSPCCTAKQYRSGKTILLLSCVISGQSLVEPIICQSSRYQSALCHICRTGYYIYGTPYRSNGNLGSTQSSLYLHGGSNIRYSYPVTPIHPTVLHIINRHPVDHHRYVFITETANVNLGISIPPTGLGSIYRRGFLEQLWKLLVTQFVHNLSRPYGRNSHRRLALFGYVQECIACDHYPSKLLSVGL